MIKLFKYLKSVWLEIVAVVICLVGQQLFALQIPRETANVTSYIELGDTAAIWKMGAIMLALSAAVLILAVIVSFLSSRIANVFGEAVRADIFKKVTDYSLEDFDKFGVSSLITRTTNDVQQVQMVILMGLKIIITAPVTLIVAITYALDLNWKLMLVLIGAVPLILIVVGAIGFAVMPLFKVMQKKVDRTTLVLRENLTGVRVIRAFNREEKETERFKEANSDLTKTYIKTNRIMSSMMPAITVIMNFTYLVIFFVGFISMGGITGEYQEIMSQVKIDIGATMAVSQYSLQIMMSLIMFAMIFVFVPRGEVSAKRINEILDRKPSIQTYGRLEEVPSSHGLLEFKNVSFKFSNAEKNTLDNISFTARPGEVTAIIGSTGSGKSSIVNLIPRFFDVTDGEILFDGQDIRNLDQKDLRNRIGFVPQKAVLFTGTIKDNLKFGNKEATDEEIDTVLDIAHCKHFVAKKENGLDTEVTQGGTNFSGGQKQRLAIARALLKKAEVYVFDDSFSALDFKTDAAIRKDLVAYTKNATTIIVAQRVSSILNASNIIVLDDGKISGQGKHEELLKTNKVYQEIVMSQLDPEEIARSQKIIETIDSKEVGGE